MWSTSNDTSPSECAPITVPAPGRTTIVFATMVKLTGSTTIPDAAGNPRFAAKRRVSEGRPQSVSGTMVRRRVTGFWRYG